MPDKSFLPPSRIRYVEASPSAINDHKEFCEKTGDFMPQSPTMVMLYGTGQGV
jgi:hypothetical protein